MCAGLHAFTHASEGHEAGEIPQHGRMISTAMMSVPADWLRVYHQIRLHASLLISICTLLLLAMLCAFDQDSDISMPEEGMCFL